MSIFRQLVYTFIVVYRWEIGWAWVSGSIGYFPFLVSHLWQLLVETGVAGGPRGSPLQIRRRLRTAAHGTGARGGVAGGAQGHRVGAVPQRRDLHVLQHLEKQETGIRVRHMVYVYGYPKLEAYSLWMLPGKLQEHLLLWMKLPHPVCFSTRGAQTEKM